MNIRVITAALLMGAVSLATAFAADPMATEYSMEQCEGSLTPYPSDIRNVQTPDSLWQNLPEQDAFLESMADACKAVFNHMGDKVLFINVANRLSVDCDCNGAPAKPKMADLGILASLDPVALDRACVDMVFNSSDPGKDDLIERINSRHGTHILDAAEELGLGSQKYRLVTLPDTGEKAK